MFTNYLYLISTFAVLWI